MSWKTVTVYADVDEVIEQIPTASLEEELKRRKDLQASDVKLAEREENRRSSDINIEIDPDDYDLVDQDDIHVSDFGEDELIDYLEGRGYSVFDNAYCPEVNTLNGIIQNLQNAQKYKLKDFLCDLFNLSHVASKDDIAAEITVKL